MESYTFEYLKHFFFFLRAVVVGHKQGQRTFVVGQKPYIATLWRRPYSTAFGADGTRRVPTDWDNIIEFRSRRISVARAVEQMRCERNMFVLNGFLNGFWRCLREYLRRQCGKVELGGGERCNKNVIGVAYVHENNKMHTTTFRDTRTLIVQRRNRKTHNKIKNKSRSYFINRFYIVAPLPT